MIQTNPIRIRPGKRKPGGNQKRPKGPLTLQQRTEVFHRIWEYLPGFVSNRMRGQNPSQVNEAIQFVAGFVWEHLQYYDPSKISESTWAVTWQLYGIGQWFFKQRPRGYRSWHKGRQTKAPKIGGLLRYSDGRQATYEDRKSPSPDALAENADCWEFLTKCLIGRQKFIVEKYFRDGLTYEEIASLLGVSRERARQIMYVGLDRMRAIITDPDTYTEEK